VYVNVVAVPVPHVTGLLSVMVSVRLLLLMQFVSVRDTLPTVMGRSGAKVGAMPQEPNRCAVQFGPVELGSRMHAEPPLYTMEPLAV